MALRNMNNSMGKIMDLTTYDRSVEGFGKNWSGFSQGSIDSVDRRRGRVVRGLGHVDHV